MLSKKRLLPDVVGYIVTCSDEKHMKWNSPVSDSVLFLSTHSSSYVNLTVLGLIFFKTDYFSKQEKEYYSLQSQMSFI